MIIRIENSNYGYLDNITYYFGNMFLGTVIVLHTY